MSFIPKTLNRNSKNIITILGIDNNNKYFSKKVNGSGFDSMIESMERNNIQIISITQSY